MPFQESTIPPVPYVHVVSAEGAGRLADDLRRAGRIALDCEAAGFHRYSDRLCLVQLTTERATYVVDPLAFDPSEVLRGPLEDPAVEVVMHGADFDLRLLARDLGIRLRGLWDTQVAAALLGEDQLGLAALLGARLGIEVSKKYQRADWADRPLSDAMLEYAANDTHHLRALADLMAQDVAAKGREPWVVEECRALEESAIAPTASEPEDPVVRVKGARDLGPRQVTALRAALEWRDAIARAKDRAVFRIVSDDPLIEAVLGPARRVEDLVAIKGFPRGLARSDGEGLLRLLREVSERPSDRLEPFPRRHSNGPGRPPPEVEELADRLKGVRNRKAAEVGLARGTLLSNAVLLEIARTAPQSLDELAAVEGMRRWKVDLLGEELLAVLRSRRA